jgi:hypothetical protein
MLIKITIRNKKKVQKKKLEEESCKKSHDSLLLTTGISTPLSVLSEKKARNQQGGEVRRLVPCHCKYNSILDQSTYNKA